MFWSIAGRAFVVICQYADVWNRASGAAEVELIWVLRRQESHVGRIVGSHVKLDELVAQSCRFVAFDLGRRQCYFEPFHNFALLFPWFYTEDVRDASIFMSDKNFSVKRGVF